MRLWKWAAMIVLSVVIVLWIAGFRRVVATSPTIQPYPERAGIVFIQDEEG